MNFQTFKNDSLNGIARTFSYDGKTVLDETEFLDGRRKYLKKTFFKNGKVESEIPFENGPVTGLGKRYYESGVSVSAYRIKVSWEWTPHGRLLL
jgi:antitoxin component YwqK of YwqJK toxin-antitoxin module